MKFSLKQAYKGSLYLESQSRVVQIIFSEEKQCFEAVLSETGATIFSGTTVEDLALGLGDKLFESVTISPEDRSTMQRFHVKEMTLEERLALSKEIKTMVSDWMAAGAKITLDMLSRRATVQDTSGKRTVVRKDDLDMYILMFEGDPVSEDTTLDFTEYLLYQILSA